MRAEAMPQRVNVDYPPSFVPIVHRAVIPPLGNTGHHQITIQNAPELRVSPRASFSGGPTSETAPIAKPLP